MLCGARGFLQRREIAERHQLAAGSLEIDLVQIIGKFLVFGRNFQQHFVLIGGRVDGGGPARAKGAVQRRFDLIGVQAERGRAVAVDLQVHLRVLHLQIRGHVHQAGEFCDLALQDLRLLVELVGVRPLQREIVSGLGLMSAEAQAGRGHQEYLQAREMRNFRPQLGDDLRQRQRALFARLQLHPEARACCRYRRCAMNELDVRILAQDVGHSLHVVHHLVVGSALRRLQGHHHGIVVFVWDEALGNRAQQVDGGAEQDEEHRRP